jgi:hypothetical protein
MAHLWSMYVRGLLARYAFLTSPSQPGFFLAWLGYAVFVAATLRWLIDVFVLAFLQWRRCQIPSIGRLEHEVQSIPGLMLLGAAVMASALVAKQTAYVRVVPLWMVETFVTLLPIALVLALAGLSFLWVDLRSVCPPSL